MANPKYPLKPPRNQDWEKEKSRREDKKKRKDLRKRKESEHRYSIDEEKQD